MRRQRPPSPPPPTPDQRPPGPPFPIQIPIPDLESIAERDPEAARQLALMIRLQWGGWPAVVPIPPEPPPLAAKADGEARAEPEDPQALTMRD